jgi:Flp pilus assembly protein TadG
MLSRCRGRVALRAARDRLCCHARRGSPARFTRNDDGQLLLLVMIYTVIAAALVLVAIDASTVFLERRSLSAAADAAALAGAQGLDRGAYYAGHGDGTLAVSDSSVRQAVAGYVAATRLPAEHHRLTVTAASPGGRGATVHLTSVVRLPFAALLHYIGSPYDGTVTVGATAHATAPLR